MSSQTTRPKVGQNLDAEIRRLGLTNDDVARALKINERQVRRWRKGIVTPSWDSLCELAPIFSREPDWFYVDRSQEEAA